MTRLARNPGNFYRIACLILWHSVCFGQIRTDYSAYIEPPLPTLPAAGGKITDPVFGTTIMRLTDAADGSDCQIGYSYWPSLNLNNTYAQAQCAVNGIMQ